MRRGEGKGKVAAANVKAGRNLTGAAGGDRFQFANQVTKNRVPRDESKRPESSRACGDEKSRRPAPR
jgi:hypothetical protein